MIIINHETNLDVCECYLEGVTVNCLKFSPKGGIIALGFDSGEIRLYELKILRNEEEEIISVILKEYQSFSPKGNMDGKVPVNA